MASEKQQAEISKITKIASYDVVRKMLATLLTRYPDAEIAVHDYGHNVRVCIHGKVISLARGTNDPDVDKIFEYENFHKLLGYLENVVGEPLREAAFANGGLPVKEQRQIDIDKWRCTSRSEQGKRCHLEIGHDCDHKGYYPNVTWS